MNRARLASKDHQGHQAPLDQVDLWGTQDFRGPWGHPAFLGLLDQRETRGSRATMAGRENGACQGCRANMERRGLLESPWLGRRVSQGPQEPRVRRGLPAPLGYLASWGRRERKAMLATPLEETEESPALQGSLGPQGRREKLVSMARPAPQDGRETRGSLERLENRDQLAPRAPRENQGKERWWITTQTSTRLSRRSGRWP